MIKNDFDCDELYFNWGLKMFSRIVKNQVGSTLTSVMIAAAIITVALTGTFASYTFLQSSLNTGRVINLAILAEDALIRAFHSEVNFPDPINTEDPVTHVIIAENINNSPNPGLRKGTQNNLTLMTDFGDITVPISTPAAPTSRTVWLREDKTLSATASVNTPIRIDISLRREVVSADLYRYAFSYEITAEPTSKTKVQFVRMGNLAEFDQQIDPGLYRAEQARTYCDFTNQIFSTGFNRDTGEAYCAQKPNIASTTCAEGHLPKGIQFIPYSGAAAENHSGTLQVACTSQPMRKLTCPTHYAITTFNPQLTDPENNPAIATTGICIPRYSPDSTLPQSSYPASPTAKYMKKVEGTFCPPYYNTENLVCNLVADDIKNNDSNKGKGKCADTKYKNCTRNTYTQVDSAQYLSWQAILKPECSWAEPCWDKSVYTADPGVCSCKYKFDFSGQPRYSNSCSKVEVSTYCTGIPNPGTASTCATFEGWTSGTPYADTSTAYYYLPTAEAIKTIPASNTRKVECSFVDTSTECTAPDLDFNGNPWGKRSAKWYGGVYLSGACKLNLTGAVTPSGPIQVLQPAIDAVVTD